MTVCLSCFLVTPARRFFREEKDPGLQTRLTIFLSPFLSPFLFTNPLIIYISTSTNTSPHRVSTYKSQGNAQVTYYPHLSIPFDFQQVSSYHVQYICVGTYNTIVRLALAGRGSYGQYDTLLNDSQHIDWFGME